jgi:hypothetical protein
MFFFFMPHLYAVPSGGRLADYNFDLMDNPPGREGTPQSTRGLFTTIGSLAGIAALLWNISWTISNAQGSYLQLALEVRPANAANATALATIENKSDFSKSIEYAALVISPPRADIRQVVEGLRRCNGEVGTINLSGEPAFDVLAYLPTTDVPLYCEGELSIIPLTFFYREQKKIGNEKLSSRNLIDLKAIRHTAADPSPSYEVRFVVRGEGRTRSTLDLLLR